MYYIYILRCEGGVLYTGIATDVERRFTEHIEGKVKGAKFTKTHKPLGVEAVWEASSRKEASMLEYRIKKLLKKEKEDLIENGTNLLSLNTKEGSITYKRIL